MVRTIQLHGSLATELGHTPIRIAVDDVQDLILALRSIYPNFRRYTQQVKEFVFLVSDKNAQNPRPLEPEFIGQRFGDAEEVHIVPAIEGAGIEVMATAGLTGWALAGAYAVNIMATMLLSMALGAVFQALAPSPSTSAGSSNQVAEKASFLYNGAVNVTQQGGPVPLVYGDFLVGSVVISTEVSVDQLLSAPSQVIEPPSSSAPPQPDVPPAVPWQWTGAYTAT
jgi:predicted phage tail protein